MEFRKNDVVTVTIDDMGSEGQGIGKVQGFTLFVKDAVVGDRVEARIVKNKKNYAYARLEKLLVPSPFRTVPKCPIYRQCGGCQLQALAYERQLSFKQEKIRNDLIRIGGFDPAFLDSRMEPIIGMEEPWHYRNKAQYPVGRDRDGNPVAGFYAGRTHSIIPNTDCALGAPENKAILEVILDYMKEYGVTTYDEASGKGLVRHVLIRKGFSTGELMVCLVINPEEGSKKGNVVKRSAGSTLSTREKQMGVSTCEKTGKEGAAGAGTTEKGTTGTGTTETGTTGAGTTGAGTTGAGTTGTGTTGTGTTGTGTTGTGTTGAGTDETGAAGTETAYLPGQQELIKRLSRIPGMTSISVSINTERTNVIMGQEIHTLWGKDAITDVIHVRDVGKAGHPCTGDGLSFRISPLSFYQVNPLQTEKLYSLALEYAGLTGRETVWDLYCGIGTISLFLAGRAKRVYGVEVVPQAIADARENARQNHIDNAAFFVGKAEEVLPAFYERQQEEDAGACESGKDGNTREKAEEARLGFHERRGKESVDAEEAPAMPCPDVIVVDPPRKGCDAACLSTMLKVQPERIVYVSCDPATLARDLKVLCEGGYEIKRVRGVDQFGMTVHVETVVLMSSK